MQFITLDSETDFSGWRSAARALVLNGVAPADTTWSVAGDTAELFGEPDTPAALCRAWRLQRACGLHRVSPNP